MSGRKRWTHLDQMVGEGIGSTSGPLAAVDEEVKPNGRAPVAVRHGPRAAMKGQT